MNKSIYIIISFILIFFSCSEELEKLKFLKMIDLTTKQITQEFGDKIQIIFMKELTNKYL